MFDRTDVLWREAPTPAPTDKAARGNDQVRQVNDQPDAPGQRPTDAADDRHTYGPPREPPDEHRTARQYRDDPARAELATERHDRERERLDRITQAREDGRTWTEGQAWTDQDRAGIQRFTKDTAAPREETDDQRVIREYDEHNAAREESNRRIDLAAYQRTPYKYTREPRPTRAPREAQPRDRRTRATRDRDAIADVGMYRAVSYTDISEQHYDNHPYVTRRAVNRMVRDGLLEEHEATGPQGNTFTVLTATARGRDAAHRAALDAGHVPEQQTWTGLVKPAELSHDTAVYRAARDERARIEADGGRVVRVRLDAELKSLVATATEKARAEGGDRAAETAKAAAAQELGLPMQDGHVMYPDAQLDIEDSQGMGGRVNVEIASDHYHAAAIVAKAGAGFSMHGSSRSANQNIGRALGRAAARETDSGPGGGSGAGREGSVEL